MLFDLSQTAVWSQRLREAIEKNPSLMQHAPGKSALLKQLAGFAARTKKQQTRDGRTGAAKAQGQLPPDDTPYAAAVEFGAKPHPIYPRHKRYLHWYESGGETLDLAYGVKDLPAGATSVFSRGVNHPGNQPQPFYFKHLPVIRERLVQALEKALNEELAKGGGSAT